MTPDWLLNNFNEISEAPEAVPRLRRFILDLAVRGKLVEQEPNDEPAAEFLKRIESKAARLTKSGELRNQQPLQPVKEAEMPFELPKYWKWVRLLSLGITRTGNTPSKNNPEYFGDYIPFVKPADLTGTEINYNGEGISREGLPYARLIPAGSVLMVCIGSSIGKVNRTTRDICCNQQINTITPFVADCEGFLALSLKADFFGKLLLGQAGTGTLPIISKGKWEKLPVPLAPLAEQHRIVAKVDELMALYDELEAAQQKRERRRDRLVADTLHGLNNGDASSEAREGPEFKESARFYFNHLPRLTTRPEHIHQLRHTILNLAVRGKLVPQDPADEPASELFTRIDEWRAESIRKKIIRDPRRPLKKIDPCDIPYPLPDGWAWARLGQVIYIQSGDGLMAENMKGGDIPVYGGNGVNGYHNAFNIMEPTIVIGRVGYYCGSVHVTPERAWVTDNAFITKFCSREIFLKFLVLLLKGTNLKENENATAQPVISGTKIYPIIIGIPPRPEQYRIVAKVDELMALCDDLESRLNTTATTRRQLLEATLSEAIAL